MKMYGQLLSGLLLLMAALSVSAAGYQLDMRDVELRDFVDTVAKLTQKTIVIDPRVSGKVDIRSHRQLSQTELYELFLAQLSVNGFTVVDVGNGILKVIPSEGARVEGVELSNTTSADSGETIVTRLIEVENVDVAKLLPLLRPLINNQSGLIESYGETNVLLVTDRESNVRRILEIIHKVDKSDTQKLEIIALKNAAAAELQQILSDLLQSRSGGQEGGKRAPTVSADRRTNSLLIRGDAQSRAYMKKVIARLDGDIQSNANIRVIYLHYAKAKDLVEVLDSVSDTLQQGEKAEIQRTEGGALRIKAHEETNSVILSGNPVMIRSMEAVIRKLDIRRAQVLVEAIIVELSENRSKELGMQWLFRGGTEGTLPFGTINPSSGSSSAASLGKAVISGTDTDLLDALAGIQGVSVGVGRFSEGALSFSALLLALANDSDTNVLSTPSLLTLDNEEASILVGQEVPVITGSTAGSNNDNPFQTITRQDVGISLKVEPQINEGNAVKLKINQEVSSLSGLTASDIITNKRQIETTVLIDDGDVIVLGGLIDDDVQESAAKVPLLGDLPLIGRLFRSDKTKRLKRNLMVFMRPTIIRDGRTLSDISHEKYHYIQRRQQVRSEDGLKLFPDQQSPALPHWDSVDEYLQGGG